MSYIDNTDTSGFLWWDWMKHQWSQCFVEVIDLPSKKCEIILFSGLFLGLCWFRIKIQKCKMLQNIKYITLIELYSDVEVCTSSSVDPFGCEEHFQRPFEEV